MGFSSSKLLLFMLLSVLYTISEAAGRGLSAHPSFNDSLAVTANSMGRKLLQSNVGGYAVHVATNVFDSVQDLKAIAASSASSCVPVCDGLQNCASFVFYQSVCYFKVSTALINASKDFTTYIRSTGFTQLISSDPQPFRTAGPDSVIEYNPTSNANNANTAHALANLGPLGSWPGNTNLAPFPAPTAHVVVGDLSEFFQNEQVKNFVGHYGSLPYDRYWGLGNHDYRNNVGDCAGNPCPLDYPDRGGLYCYPLCAAGYSSDGGSYCYQNCPQDWPGTTSAQYCEKKVGGEYGRGGGYCWFFNDPLYNCEKDNGSGNCDKWGTCWYPKCAPYYHPVGCCICSPDCPSGFDDIGVSCKRPSYNRGNGWAVASLTSLANNNNLCATSAVRSMQNLYKPQKYKGAAGWDEGSSSYSWTNRDYTFIMLHENPFYTRHLFFSADSINKDFPDIQPSIIWLNDQVTKATVGGSKVVLYIHNVYDDMGPLDLRASTASEFHDILKTGSVVAIIRGHTHLPPHGFDGNTIEGVPVLNAGASWYQTFLLSHFTPDYFAVGVVGLHGNQAYWRGLQSFKLVWSAPFKKWVVDNGGHPSVCQTFADGASYLASCPAK